MQWCRALRGTNIARARLHLQDGGHILAAANPRGIVNRLVVGPQHLLRLRRETQQQ